MEEFKSKTEYRSLSWRALVVGLLCVAFISVFSPFSDLVVGTVWSGAEYLPLNIVFIFTVLVLGINFLLRKLKIGLTEPELLFIYCMMLVTGCIASLGLVHSLIPITTSAFYRATPENRWAQLLHPNLPGWFIPSNPDSIKYLWEGLPEGVSIPWQDWLRPFTGWALLALAMYLVMFCLAILVRKQWVENERLIFPLVYLPVEMSREEKGFALSSFFRDRIMWLGFAIPAILLTINGLNFYFPNVPAIKLFFRIKFVEKPWDGLNPLKLNIIFSAVGLIFLLPAQLSFSLWFFFFFFRIQAIIGSAIGRPMPYMFTYPTRAFIGYQIAGGMLTFAIFLFWAARGEIKKIFARAFKKEKFPEESSEPIPYRYAVLGLIAGVLFISFWGASAGASPWFTMLIFAIFFLIILSATRLASEGGIYFFQASFRPSDLIIPFVGSSALGITNIVPLIGPVEHIFMRDQRSAIMPSFLHALKISESGRLNRRHLSIVVFVSILLSMVISYPTYLFFMYKYGGINATGYTWSYGPHWGSQHTANLLNNPQKPNFVSIVLMVVGSGTMIFFLWMRRIFLWWPFHPLGYIMGDSWPTVQLWFPILLGWAIKAVVMKLGGIKIYRKLMPGFLGLVLGEFTVKGLWVIIDMFTGAKGHTVAPFL